MNIISGLLATTLAFSSGTGLLFYSGNDVPNRDTAIQEHGVRYNNATTMMETNNFEKMEMFMGNGNVKFDKMQKFMDEDNRDFRQMKPYMNEMHPNLDNSELKEFYRGMHGTASSSRSSNFRMMKDF